MGGNALKKFGIETDRKTTKEMLDIFSDISKIITDQVEDMFLVKFYREKETHGDLDILVKGTTPKLISEFVKDSFNPRGLFINGDVVTFDYNNFQIDLICVNDNWEMHKIYYSYDPLPNLMGKIAKGFGLRYGSRGLFYKSVGKSNTKEFILTTDSKKIFDFLGYDFNRFNKGFDTLEEIFNFIANGKFYDERMFYPKNLTSNDRKRSMKRTTYREFLNNIHKYESKYDFRDNKESYVNYIDAYFPGFKDKVMTHRKIDKLSIDTNKKMREVLKDYKSDKFLGDTLKYFKLSLDDYENYILSTNLEDIRKDFDDFYRRRYTRKDKLNENIFNREKIVNDFESFKMIVKNYDITDMRKSPYVAGFGSKEIDWKDVFNNQNNPNTNRYIRPYEKGNIY